MMNAVNTTQRMRRKERHKFSRTMAVILGLIVTLEVMVAGGMIFNIDFHSADMVAVVMGFMVLYAGDCGNPDRQLITVRKMLLRTE